MSGLLPEEPWRSYRKRDAVVTAAKVLTPRQVLTVDGERTARRGDYLVRPVGAGLVVLLNAETFHALYQRIVPRPTDAPPEEEEN